MGRFIIKHIDNRKPQVKMYPSDAKKPVKGLIERTESSKTILTEDNKELLND